MKKTRLFTFLIASLFTLAISAQGIVVHQGNSKKVSFKSKDVQKIEFTENQVENTTENYVEKSELDGLLDELRDEINKKLDASEAEELWAKIKSILESISELQEKIEAGGGSGESSGGSSHTGINNGHEYVDLGLSVKWATMNVGATEVAGSKTNSHTGQLDCYGEYYAWGETSPKDEYTWSNLKYCSGDTNKGPFAKYVASSSYGTVDNKNILESEDDAASANWGGTWRMPTKTEQDELRTKCTWTWTTMNGVVGYKVSASNGNSIFLPAAGSRDDSSFIQVGSYGCYHLSSLYNSYTYDACNFYFYSGFVDWGYSYRNRGRSVRAVCP